MQTQPSARIPLLEQFGITKADLGGYWNFADVKGNAVVDLSGHGNTIKLTDKRMQAEGPTPGTKALSLSPKQFVEIANREQLWGHEKFTINFWMRMREQQNNTGSLITKCALGPFDFRIQIGPAPNFVLASQKISWYGANSAQMVWSNLDNSDLTDRWMMLTISFDGQRIRSYIDGKLDTESSVLDTGKWNNTASPMRIGSEPAYNIPGFDGSITELAVIKHALSGDELASFYAKYCQQLPLLAPTVDKTPSGIASISSAKVSLLKGTDPVFEQPGPEYRLVQYIMGFRANFDELQKYGIGSVVLGLPHENYLHNDRAWADVEANLDDAIKRKMGAWVYDEDAYPSGAAGGLTVDGHPEYVSYGVCQVTHLGKGRKSLTVNLPKDAMRFVAAVLYPVVNGKMRYKNGSAVACSAASATTDGMDGDWAFCVYVAKKMLGHPERRKTWFNHGEYPNLLNADAVKRYIAITHAAYQQHFGSRFRYLTAFYTGEPSLATVANFEFTEAVRASGESYLPWDDSIQQAFRADHGYELLPCLAAMYLPQSDEGNIIRRHFWQTVGNLMSKNFFGQIAEWCAKNGSSLSGHLLLEEWMSCHVSLYGNFMQSMEHFKIAGYDHYFNRHGISQANNLVMQKYSFSGNRAHGNFVAQALIEPILSGYLDTVTQQLRMIPISVYRQNINMMCAGGASIINSYVNYNAYPVDEFRNVTDYAARLCYFLRGTRDVAKVAVYYPIETFQGRYRPTPQNVFTSSGNPEYQTLQKRQDALFETLFRQNIDFNLLDADAIGRAQLADGAIKIAGYEYKAMIMPDMDIIPLATLQKLLRFVSQGGVLIWSGKIPALGDSEAETPQVKKLLAGAHTTGDLKKLVSNVSKIGAGGLTVTATRPDRFYFVPYTRNIEGRPKKIFLLVNDHSRTNTLKIGGRGHGVLYDPWKGEYAVVTLPLSVGVEAYSAMVLAME